MDQVNGGIILPAKIDADAEDLVFLSSGGAIRRIGLPIGASLRPEFQRALHRAQDNGWVALVDIEVAMHANMAQQGPLTTRVFRVTDAGVRRVREIKQRRNIDVKLKEQT